MYLGYRNRAVATRPDLLCKVHGPSLSVPQVKRQGTHSGAALSCTPEISSCRNFQQLGKWIHFYYDDQEPGNAPFNSFSLSILPLPCPPPRFFCIGSSHVSIRRPELAYYHCNTLSPSPWPRRNFSHSVTASPVSGNNSTRVVL